MVTFSIISRSTGIPTIQAKLAENGSPRAVFATTDDRRTFLVTIPVNAGCNESSVSSERKGKSSERILELIKKNPTISAAEIAMEMDMSSRGVEKQIRKLREAGIIQRVGADYGGRWEIIKDRYRMGDELNVFVKPNEQSQLCLSESRR